MTTFYLVFHWVHHQSLYLQELVVVFIQKLPMLALTLLVRLKPVFLRMTLETLLLLPIMLVTMLVMLPVWVLIFLKAMQVHLSLLFHLAYLLLVAVLLGNMQFFLVYFLQSDLFLLLSVHYLLEVKMVKILRKHLTQVLM